MTADFYSDGQLTRQEPSCLKPGFTLDTAAEFLSNHLIVGKKPGKIPGITKWEMVAQR